MRNQAKCLTRKWEADLCKRESLELKVRALLAVRRHRVGYKARLEAAVEACR